MWLICADCQCGTDFNFVCAFGLTWQSTCDAACGGYSCPGSPGVCHYKGDASSGQLVTPNGRDGPGGAPPSPSWGGTWALSEP